jgi:hypothetical protein
MYISRNFWFVHLCFENQRKNIKKIRATEMRKNKISYRHALGLGFNPVGSPEPTQKHMGGEPKCTLSPSRPPGHSSIRILVHLNPDRSLQWRLPLFLLNCFRALLPSAATPSTPRPHTMVATGPARPSQTPPPVRPPRCSSRCSAPTRAPAGCGPRRRCSTQ